MAKLPYFQFYPADWLSSPRIMCSTLVQQGAYIRLLCVCWLSGDCSVPADQKKLAMLSGLPEQELEFVYQMFSAHPQKEGHLTNERLLKEWERAHWISDKRSQAGKISGKSRRTHVQHEFKQNANKKETCADKSEFRSQNSEVRLQKIEVRRQKEEKKKSCGQVKPLPATPKSKLVWDAYAEAYVKKYGVAPVRNQQVNALLCRVVDKLGTEEAPAVAAFYVSHNNPFYVSKRHPPNLLVQDAEGLRTQWATGVLATKSEARTAEKQMDATHQAQRLKSLIAPSTLRDITPQRKELIENENRDLLVK